MTDDTTCARLARATWFTLESSARSDAARNASRDFEAQLASVGQPSDAVAAMGLSWMGSPPWSSRATWPTSGWISATRSFGPWAKAAFSPMNDEEKKLLIEFMNYRAWYANAQDTPPHQPENVGDDMTAEKQVQIVDGLLTMFEERFGNPLAPCTKCDKRAIGKKMPRCSRCRPVLEVYYCSVECQRANYKKHKKACKAAAGQN